MSETVMDEATDQPIDDLGPVDCLVVEFRASASPFNGEMASALVEVAEILAAGDVAHLVAAVEAETDTQTGGT